jgi:EAL domain-containing protein (putative c-di-GMP-specific phosphodiesterase class I)
MTNVAVASSRIKSMLVVDDSIVQREYAVGLCRDLGVEVVYEAGNGTEALELLHMLRLPPDLMVLDLEMPGMDGIELIQQFQQRDIRVPFIVASSRENGLIDAVHTMSRSMGLPMLAGLQKPICPKAMREVFDIEERGPQLPQSSAGNLPVKVGRADLLKAIEAGEITVAYQPKVDIATGLVRGVEALARWHHPRHGSIGPAAFVPLAEREDLVHGLTMSVAGQAMAQAAAWNSRGMKLNCAVNLSPQLLGRPRLVDELSTLVDRHQLAAEQITFEVTESSLAPHLGTSLGVLARLRLKGFGLSIDDYGTGFSSMQQLARIPFTELKIDKTFVHDACGKRNLRIILQSALDMSRRLNLVTVAEGIETLADWQLLQEYGCSMGQGYLIATPMAGDELPRWLKSHQRRLGSLRKGAAA